MFHFLNGEGSGLKPHPILNDRLITSSSQIYHKFYRYTLLYDKFPLSSKENSRILHEIRKGSGKELREIKKVEKVSQTSSTFPPRIASTVWETVEGCR